MANYAFGILPTIIRQDSRVSDFACRLYSEVDSLSNKFGYCFATNSALGKALGKAPGTISRTLAELESFNYVNLVIEDRFKRKIYPKRDFREFEGVDEFEQGGNQKRLGGYSEMSMGVVKNGMTTNKNNLIRKSIKKTEEVVETSSTVTLIDEVDETSVEIHHIPEYFDTEQKPKEKKVAPKKEKVANPAPTRAMFQYYEQKYAELNRGELPIWQDKYAPALKKLHEILTARCAQKGIIQLDPLQPWKDFIDMWALYLNSHPKEQWHRDNFNPMTMYSQFNGIIAKLNAQPAKVQSDRMDKWEKWAIDNGIKQTV